MKERDGTCANLANLVVPAVVLTVQALTPNNSLGERFGVGFFTITLVKRATAVQCIIVVVNVL